MNKSNRVIAFLLAVLTLLSSISWNNYVEAASSKSNMAMWEASIKDSGVVSELKAGYAHGKVLYCMLDGETAYCMNFGLSADGGQLMNSFKNSRTSLTAKQENYLKYCLYYGFKGTNTSEPSSSQKDKYIATQAMVWIIEQGIFNSDDGNSAAKKLCNTAPDASNSYEYYKTLKSKMLSALDAEIPSFASAKTSDAETYVLEWNEENDRYEKTLTDSNKVLKNFNLTIDGFKKSVDGNKLTIYSSSVNDKATVGTFASNDGTVRITGSCVFWLKDGGTDKYQEFISEVPAGDPIPAYIKVKTESIGFGELYKKDNATNVPLAGAVYGLYSNNSCTTLVQQLTTDNKGYAKSSELTPGTYYVKEITAPNKYVVDTKVYTLAVKAGKTTTLNMTDARVKAKINLKKVDKETGESVPQGDAKLAGAIYGLYAKSAIVHPDGTTGTIYNANNLVSTMTIDASGNAEVKDLYLGNYYVKEIKAPLGYAIDTNTYDVNCDYEGQSVAEVIRSVTSSEQVFKQPFQLIKVANNGKTDADLLQGIGFSVYLKSALQKKADGSYDYTRATPIVIAANNSTELFTDEKGYAQSIPIPYGTYVVRETTVKHNYLPVADFEVPIEENKPTEPKVWRVLLDEEFSAKLKIIKKDSNTKKAVLRANTEFKIFNLDKKEYVEQYTTYPTKVKHTSYFTNNDGYLITPQKLSIGNYRIEEVSAPYGYVLNEKGINIAVDTNTYYEIDSDVYEAIIPVEYENLPVRGELTVIKKGEVLLDYSGSLFDKDGEFEYKESNLAGAEFMVYADENIYTADCQKDENGVRIKEYTKGQLVGTIVTGEDGKATLSNLPLGKYKIIETKAPYGYILNKDEQKVSFVYVDSKTPVVYESVTCKNERQKVSLSIVKKDKETDESIAGAKFGIYAADNILNYAGKVAVKKDKLIETATSDEHGIISFVKDYPLGMYYVKEIEAPKGYVSTEEIISFDATYQGQDVKVVELESIVLNMPTTFEFTKTDITSGAELNGASLTVLDIDGNVVDTWTSDASKPHIIKKLVVGQTYVLREEFAPYGYLKATDVEFTVNDTAEVQFVEMKDEVPTGTIIINKKGEFLTDTNLVKDKWYSFIFDYFKNNLEGVTFDVYAAEDIISPDGLNTIYYTKDELVNTIVTNSRGIAVIENLPLGKYYLVEKNTIEGFVLDSKPIMADLTYIDQHTKVVYAGMDINNERQKVKITVVKKEFGTETNLSGAIFGLYAKEDIINADGRVLQEKDTLIEKRVTEKNGQTVFLSDLPLGKYYVKEIQAPEGFVKSDKSFDVDATYKGENVSIIEFTAEFENQPTSVEISKTDITGEHELVGATLSIIDAEGNVVEEWVSGKKPHMIKKLHVGSYILREETAPYGYKIANDVAFDVKETATLQKVSMKDELVNGKIVIHKTDENTKKGIEGVTFEVRDKKGNVIDKLITNKKGNAESKELPIAEFKDGNFKKDIVYYVVETKAANGYILDGTPHEVKLQYDDEAPEVVVYELNLTNKPTEPKLPQTGDNMNLFLFVGLGIVSILGGIGVLKVKKNKKEV